MIEFEIEGTKISGIDTWIFDLDNTLYPASCNLFSQVSDRMGAYIARMFDVDANAARKLQKNFFRTHGTTLRGLMTEHQMQPDEFLHFVHDIDFSVVKPSPLLSRALDALPGRKFIFTNASAAYADKVLARLGVGDVFEGVFDIHNAGYTPKPDPETYRKMLSTFKIEAQGAIMFEDMARNLAPAVSLGMKTAWIPTHTDWGHEGAAEMDFNFVIEDLPDWLWRVSQTTTVRG